MLFTIYKYKFLPTYSSVNFNIIVLFLESKDKDYSYRICEYWYIVGMVFLIFGFEKPTEK